MPGNTWKHIAATIDCVNKKETKVALFVDGAKVKESKIVIETGADQVRIELEKWAISSNETATEAAKEEEKKAKEAKAKAKAAKKAEKN